MRKTLAFYYDFGSPTCYLAWTQLPALCARYGATLDYKPVLLGGIFKACENRTPIAVKAKADWMIADMQRYAARYGVPFSINPHFIFNSMAAMRGATWAKQAGGIETYNKALFEAAWVKGLNVSDPEVIESLVAEARLDAEAMAAAIKEPTLKQVLIDETNAAVARGVFGAPTYFIDGVMHFGQDRLDWIEEALSGKRVA